MDKRKVVQEVIEQRRSVYPKNFLKDPISQDVLEEILHSATFAPNHKKTKPWRFRVFKGEEKAKLGQKLASLYQELTPSDTFLEKKYLDILSKAEDSNVILTISVHFSGLVNEWEEVAATAMAVQNMYLTCTVNGVGCYWSTPPMKDYLSEFLELGDNEKCYGFFYMGKIDSAL